MIMSNTQDILLRGTIDDERLRFAYVLAPKTLADGIITHDCDPVGGMIFGEAMLCALLSVPLMKGDQRTTLRWEYAGPIGKVICESDHTGAVRGIPANPSLMGAAQNEDELFGDSGKVSSVLSDLKTGKILNTGTVEAGMMDIVNDFALLYCISDQVETEAVARISFRADPNSPVAYAAAIMLQAMPGTDLERFEEIRNRLHDNEILDIIFDSAKPPATALADGLKALGCQGRYDIHRDGAPAYSCPCERGRMIESVKTLARAEIEHIFDDRDEIELVCQFCRKKYKLKRDEC